MDITPSRRFELTATLGQGGFGTVYRAVSVGEGGFRKIVALKVLRREYIDHTEVVARLRDEARILSMLRHRAVTAVEDLLLLNGSWTLVMEFVDGVSLGSVVRQGPVPLRPALEITQEIASVLHAAYTAAGPTGTPLRILHRDLKPANVLLTSTGAVKVLDFGIARAEFDEREAETRSIGFGSPEYMAPERLAGDNGPGADVYALGAVLYEMLTGERFGRTQINPEKMAARIQAATNRILEIHGEAARPAAELAARCLHYDAEARPTAREVEQACDEAVARAPRPRLRDWAEEKVPLIRSTVTEQPLPQGDGTVLVEVQTGRTVQPSASPLPLPLIAAVVAALVFAVGIAAAGLFAVFQMQKSKKEAEIAMAEAEAARSLQEAQALEAETQRKLEAERRAEEERRAAEEAQKADDEARAVAEARRLAESTRAEQDRSNTSRTTASAGSGTVSVEGDGVVTLSSGNSLYKAPSTVPAGDYEVSVSFNGQDPVPTGRVSVPAGGSIRLTCRATYKRCQVK